VRGTKALRKIFTKEQRAFFAEHAPAGIDFDALVPLGPTFILKLTFFPKELQRRFVAELWLYQDGSRILELSTKALANEAFQVAAETRAYLVSKGVDVSGVQQTKTRTALTFFRNQLKAAEKAAARKSARAAAEEPMATPAAQPEEPVGVSGEMPPEASPGASPA
jgi:hypothetical protein